jgi:hypothetical protein
VLISKKETFEVNKKACAVTDPLLTLGQSNEKSFANPNDLITLNLSHSRIRPTSIQAELQVFDGSPAAAGDALIGQTGWRMIARKTGPLDSSS